VTGTYGYDANGNRTSQSGTGGTSAYGYLTGTNRLQSISGAVNRSYSYDGAGNIVADGQHSYAYDATNRLSALDGGQTQYRYNGLGQRVQKTGSTISYAAWDEQGRVIGEYDAGGTVQETVYVGTTPVAVIQAGVAYSVDADQVDAPRVIRGPSGLVAWRWDTDAFGAAAANANPSGAGAFAYNSRFPGQLFDAETAKHYNGFRDYDPATGRYVESNPIGLAGGINTYSYVNGNPVSFVDPRGLSKTDPFYGLGQKFWNWFHKQPEFKDLKGPDGLVDPNTAKDYYKEWKDLGKPNPRDKERGSVDPDILDWLIPWWLTPSPLACPKGEPGCPCQ
jgi:RHS repeat-associated protein